MAESVAPDAAVTSLNTLKGDVTIEGTGGTTVTKNGNTITINSAGGGAGVSTINNQNGALTFQGGGGTTVSNVGGVFTISSSGGGGTGIQGVQSTDGSLSVTNANGPTATLNIASGGVKTAAIADGAVTTVKYADNSITNAKIQANAVGYVQIAGNAVNTASIADNAITTPKIANAAVTPAKIGTSGATNGQVLTYNGSAAVWANASGGGNGIQGVTNADGTLSITNPNGPTATIDIAANGIGNTKLANDMASLTKVSGGLFSGAAGNVTINGHLNFANDGLSLIFPACDATNEPMIYMFNSGTGNGDRMVIAHSPTYKNYGLQYRDNGDEFRFLSASTTVMTVDLSTTLVGIGNIDPTAKLEISNESTASGLKVSNTSGSNTLPALDASTSGTGKGANIQIANASNSSNALEATTNGTGIAVRGLSSIASGTTTGIQGEAASTTGGSASSGVSGVLGKITSTAPGGYSAGVRGINNSTTGNGIGVVGYHAGSGWGVYGETPNGIGTVGITTTTSGVTFGVAAQISSPSGAAVIAKYTGSGAGIAMQLDNGAIKVSGTNKSAFLHTATAGNSTSNYTTIDNPLTNGDANAILIITPNLVNSVYTNFPIGVWYNAGTSKWTIFNQNSGGSIPNNAVFNVLVIKQ
jgi:hypothetical protein